MKHNGSLSGSFPISNGVKQGCVLAPTLFPIFFSIILLRQKRACQAASTFISEQTAVSSTSGLQPPRTQQTIGELVTELLFADCALLAHMEEALQHIVNRFSDAAKNFGLTISLKKSETLNQPLLREAYGTNLNAVEHFTYLVSVISNDATVSKDLDNR